MRHLACQPIQDGMLLRVLSRNKSARSYPKLREKAGEIALAYRTYLVGKGCANTISPLGLDSELGGQLIGHYARPPKSHHYIKALRDDTAALTCPMCGSPSCGTLDHVLPKEHFPEFSLYSKNLVPACLCNSKRGSTFKASDGSRILHPYFDTILKERLVGCLFDDHGLVPSLRIVNLLPLADPHYASVNFHIENVVQRTALKAALRRDWTALMLKPGNLIRDLRRNPESLAHFTQILEDELSARDEVHQSRNNWASVFITGLLVPHTAAWLYLEMTKPGRMDNAPIAGSR